jgi:hypothetical protein
VTTTNKPVPFNKNFLKLSEKVCELNFLPKVNSFTYHFLGSLIKVIFYGYGVTNIPKIYNISNP